MFIPYLVIIFSILSIVVIVLRKIPILLKLPTELSEAERNASLTISLKEKVIDVIQIVARPNYGLVLLGWLEKILRKFRIVFLKVDNFFVDLIIKSREKSHQWTIKSREWMSERRMKKIERLKLMANLRMTPEQKEENLLRALKQNPRDVKAYKELGLLYLEQKNFQDAQAAFKEVLKINPEDEVAKEKLEEIKALENGNIKETQ